jgi:hypothetical protein
VALGQEIIIDKIQMAILNQMETLVGTMGQ